MGAYLKKLWFAPCALKHNEDTCPVSIIMMFFFFINHLHVGAGGGEEDKSQYLFGFIYTWSCHKWCVFVLQGILSPSGQEHVSTLIDLSIYSKYFYNCIHYLSLKLNHNGCHLPVFDLFLHPTQVWGVNYWRMIEKKKIYLFIVCVFPVWGGSGDWHWLAWERWLMKTWIIQLFHHPQTPTVQ